MPVKLNTVDVKQSTITTLYLSSQFAHDMEGYSAPEGHAFDGQQTHTEHLTMATVLNTKTINHGLRLLAHTES